MRKSTKRRGGEGTSSGPKLTSGGDTRKPLLASAADRWKRRTKSDLESLLSALLVAGSTAGDQAELDSMEDLSDLYLSNRVTEMHSPVQSPALWPAIKQMILDRELRDLALTDDLTCFYNRRGFYAAATQQLKFARRNGQRMMLFYCDVNNLGEINQLFGREEGDFALVRTADAIEEAFRDADLLARLRDDEFAVLASGAAGTDEEAVLRRLETCIQRANSTEPRYPLSLTVGAVEFDPNHPAQIGELMELAERSMKERKQRRSFLFSPELGSD